MNPTPRIVLTLALLGAAPLLAQDADRVLAEAFARLDRDRDGKVERDEFPGSDGQFRALAPGEDGAVSAAEFARSPLGLRLVAARVRDDAMPRKREDADAQLGPRIEAAARLDRNRDGKVTRQEWPGDDLAFTELDLDDDGDIDRADRSAARRRAPNAAVVVEVGLPEFKARIDQPERLFRKLDRDGDGNLSGAELRGKKIAPALAWADRDRDGRLSAREFEQLVRAIAEQVRTRDRGDARPRAYRVRFSSWDRNHDGRLETAEWRGSKYLFARIDQDRDAALTEVEVERYVRSVEGMTFFERFDLNGDGRVTFEEFGGSPGAFRRADRNGDGAVTRADR